MNQREDMRKNPFWYFWLDQLWPFNFHFGRRPKYSNHNILVSAHPIWKLKIVPESSRSRESMVRKTFWYFECFTFGNPCDSSTSPRANFWPVTSEKFLRHGFSVFYLNLMKYISELNETCFFMILNENPIIWSLVQFFSFWSNFHRPHIILVLAQLRITWDAEKK